MADSNLLKQITNYYEGLAARDRLMLQILAVFLFLLFCYLAVWKPAKSFKENSLSNMEYYQNLVVWIKNNQNLIKKAASGGQSGTSRIRNAQELVSAVSAKARQHQLVLQRLEPNGQNKLRVWLEKASFNNTVLWLQDLKKAYNISVSEIVVNKEKQSGQVTVRMTLKS